MGDEWAHISGLTGTEPMTLCVCFFVLKSHETFLAKRIFVESVAHLDGLLPHFHVEGVRAREVQHRTRVAVERDEAQVDSAMQSFRDTMLGRQATHSHVLALPVGEVMHEEFSLGQCGY